LLRYKTVKISVGSSGVEPPLGNERHPLQTLVKSWGTGFQSTWNFLHAHRIKKQHTHLNTNQ